MPVTLEDIDREIARRQSAPAQGGITLEQIDAELARRNQAAPSVASPVGGGAEPLPRGAGIPEMVIPPPQQGPIEHLGLQGLPSQQDAQERSSERMQSLGQAAFTPEVFRAGGATLGTALGSTAGLPGALAGGVLGAGAGQSAFDLAQRGVAALSGEEAPQTVAQDVGAIGEAALEEATFAGAGAVAGPVVKSFKPLLGKLLGVGGEPTKQVIKEAEKQGIPLAAAQLSKKPSVKNFSQVIGVFPFVGTPFKKLGKATGEAIDTRTAAILNELAPTATTADLGVDLAKAAQGRFKNVSRIGGALYKDFADKVQAIGNPAIVPTDSTMRVAENFRELMKQERILPAATPQFQGSTGRLKAVKPTGQQDILKTTAALRNPLDQFFLDFADLPPRLTVLQTRGLQRSLNDAVERASAQGFDISRASQLKQALEQDLNSLDVSSLAPDVGAPIVEALQKANSFWAENMKPFETATGKRFGRVDRNIFSPKFAKPGGTNPDEAFRAVVNTRSPQAMADLRALVGDETMKGVARRNVEDAFGKATAAGGPKGSAISFDPATLATNLGLDDATGRKVLAESLKGTGTSVADLERFVDVTRTAADFAVPDVSSFLQRRLTLGGLRSLLATGVAGVGLAQAPVTAVTMGILARQGSKILASPKALKAMTTALDDSVSDKLRRTALLRLGSAVLPDDETVPEASF